MDVRTAAGLKSFETVGVDSRCFLATLFEVGEEEEYMENVDEIYAFCFKMECKKHNDNNQTLFITANNYVTECSQEDFQQGLIKNIPGVIGDITCPDPAVYCQKAFPNLDCADKNYCNMNGKCAADKTCVCGIGWFGEACD